MARQGSPGASPSAHDPSFVPAAGRDWLLPLYDPLCRLLGAHRYRARLLDAADLRPGARVLDLGCGTGALSLQAKAREPGIRLTGLDPDPKALARARAKALRAGAEVHWQQGFGDALPFPDASFDRVVSALVFHHLTAQGKRDTLREVARVLAPGGTLHVLDFGPPRGALERMLLRLFHHDERLDDNLAGRIPARIEEAGLREVATVTSLRTPFGRLELWHAAR